MKNASHARRKPKTSKLKLPAYTYLVFSLILIILGSALIFIASVPQNVPFFLTPKSQPKSAPQISTKPVKLYIPKIDKILYVSDGFVQGDRWEISQTGVSYLTTSAAPGTVGNTVIYGHNLNDILGYLPNVTSGDSVYVTLANGGYVKYQVTETKEVTPNQIEILNQTTTDSRLTLYTCTGFLDSARFVVVAQKVQQV